MYRRGRRYFAIGLTVAALALSAGPAAAAGGEADAGWSLGMEVWTRLDQLGDWLRTTFLSDYTSFIDPDVGTSHNTSDGTSFIDPNGGTSHSTSDHTSFIDPNG